MKSDEPSFRRAKTWLKIFEGLGARRPGAMFLDAIFYIPGSVLANVHSISEVSKK